MMRVGEIWRCRGEYGRYRVTDVRRTPIGLVVTRLYPMDDQGRVCYIAGPAPASWYQINEESHVQVA